MKLRFDRVIPETPETFHNAFEAALRETAARPAARPVRLRPAVVLAASMAVLLLAGTAFAITNSLGLWDFLQHFGGREVPSDTPPQTEIIDSSAASDDYTFTVLEAYREGRNVTILASLSENGAEMDDFLPWESVHIRTEDNVYLEVLDEHTVVDGASCHVLTCILPEDAPDETTLYVSLDWYVKDDIPVTLTRREGTAYGNVTADHTTIAGTGITFTDMVLETTALNRTLTLRYTFDPEAVTPPELPSQYMTYYTGGDNVYHTKADCAALTGTVEEIALKDIDRQNMVSCAEDGCTFFTTEYEPLWDSLYLELLDVEGNPLPSDSLMERGLIQLGSQERRVTLPDGRVVIESTLIEEPAGESFETVFLLDGLPETIRLRVYDCDTKYRWKDTVTLTIQE